MELLSFVPKHVTLEQAVFILESMTTLRPKLLQSLLEQCVSRKVKRLFLVLAENESHGWWKRLDLAKIQFGKGKLKIGKGGYYYSKYLISLPIKLNQHEGYNNE